MKIRKLSLLLLSAIFAVTLCAGLFTACAEEPDNGKDGKWTVTFFVDDAKYGNEVMVSNNRRIPASAIPANPSFNDDRVFTAWYTSKTEFIEENKWNFDKGMVTRNLDLHAGYRVISEYPTELKMAQEPCTSKITWTQSSLGENYTVTLDGAPLAGTATFDATEYLVTFTPSELPQGGEHTVTVTDAAHPQNTATAEDLIFGGAGKETNPYLVYSALDFTALSLNDVEQNTYFKLCKNITVAPDYDAQTGKVFNGILDGDGRTVTIENGNCGLLSEIGVQGSVTTLNIAGSVSTLKDSVGALVGINRGRVQKINITANVTSTAGTVGSNGLAAMLEEGKGIAGGVVGTNEETGVVYNCKIVTSSSSDGVVKAAIGGGCIVGYNKGTVESCVSEGAFGAWNSTETGGKTLSAYSYSGGVVGVNAGLIKECELSGSGKLLAQRYGDASLVIAGTNHIAMGGIAGYNTADGLIEKCTYSGIRVHGDEAIGGIAGINAGEIKNCLAEGVHKGNSGVSYVGGRVDVGGIAGRLENNGTVRNCVSTVNVFAYTQGTAFGVASKADNCVYLTVNSNKNSLETNPDAVALSATAGSGNAAVTETFNGTESVKLPESYLTTVNGDGAFRYDGDTIKVITTDIPELSLIVTLVGDGTSNTQEVPETPVTLSVPKKSGYRFTGWSFTQGGEIAFAKGVQVSYYDLKDYRDEHGAVTLYANFEERIIDNNVLNVSIWNNAKGEWINGDQIEKIKTDFTAYLADKGINASEKTINWIVETETSVAKLGESVNNADNIDLIVACGTNVTSTGKVECLAKTEISSTEYAAANRLAAILTENELAKHLYSMLTGAENATAEVTLVGDTTVTTTISGLFGDKATVPEVTVDQGKKFVGWATTQNAQTAQVTGNITYSAVKNLLSAGKVTLYPVFEDLPAVENNDLIIVFYDKFFDAEKVEPLKTAFAEYCTANSVSFGTLTFECAVTGNNAAFNTYLTEREGGFDIAVGGKSTSSAPIECLAGKESVNLTYAYDGKSDSRPVVFMNDRAVAQAFKAFMQTDAASAILNQAA